MIRLIVYLFLLVASSLGLRSSATNVFEQFKISTAGAEVYNHTEFSLRFESKIPTYQVKLEPNVDGKVMFTIGRYGFRSTVGVRNLQFGIKIEGFSAGEVVMPSIVLDKSTQEINVNGNVLIFTSIINPIPVSFNTQVDSIKLQFTNSHGLNVHQILTLDDVHIAQDMTVKVNPKLVACDNFSMMFGIEGVSSREKSDRKSIAKHMLSYFKTSIADEDSNAICIMEFNEMVHSVSESSTKKRLIKNTKNLKKGKDTRNVNTGYSNWEAAFDQAIKKKPDVFIFIVERWSNFSNDGPKSINGQFKTLIEKCNKIKSNGTRLLFITSGLNSNGYANTTLYSLLNSGKTTEIIGHSLNAQTDLSQVDLISIDDFEKFSLINFSSLLKCKNTNKAKDLTLSNNNKQRSQFFVK